MARLTENFYKQKYNIKRGNKMKEQIIEILEDIVPGEDFENASHLIDDEILDSLDIVTLVSELSDAFDVEITAADIIPENFQTVEAMTNLIKRLEDE